MNIAVNVRLLIKNKLEGIGWFTYESFRRITMQHPEHHFFFIFDRSFHPDYVFSDNITPIILSPQARHPFLFWYWFDYSIPPLLRSIDADVFVSPDGYLSTRSSVKSLAVIHDLNFEHYPQDLPFLVRKYYRHFFPKFATGATRIATVSQYSKEDIIKQYGVPAEKIDVVYDGSNEEYLPVTEEEARQVREQCTEGAPYFVFIGSLQPRKNLANLFTAFDDFKKRLPSDVRLAIVGEKKWWTREIREAFDAMEHSQAVIFLGRQKTSELRKILASSLALVYVSYFEGFGIPIVEAFRSHVPVITSDVTSMPEIAGGAAMLVDPFNPVSIADGMMKIYQDPAFRNDLIRRGIERKEVFTWQRTADLLWESIEKTFRTN